MDTADFLEDLERVYPHRVLVSLYQDHWKAIIERQPQTFPQLRAARKNPRKRLLVEIFAIILGDPELCRSFFQSLPALMRKLAGYLAWEGSISLVEVEKQLGISLCISNMTSYYRPDDILKPEYRLFKIWCPYQYGYRTKKDYLLYLPAALSISLKEILEKPKNYELHPDEPPKKSRRHSEPRILEILTAGRFFVNGGHVKISAYGDRILKTSLKRFASLAGIAEFFDGNKRDLALIKTRHLLDFLKELDGKRAPTDGLPFLRYLVGQCLTQYQFSFASFFLDHLKGQSFLWEFPDFERREIPAELLKRALVALPVHTWVSFQNIWDYLRYRNLVYNFDEFLLEFQTLYFHESPGRYYQEKVYVTPENIHLVISIPLLKGAFFFFSALGILDIAFTEPVNSLIQREGKGYLSVYDGLTHVRLTQLGAFLLGRTDRYEDLTEEDPAEVEVDPDALILQLKGKDLLKTMVLEQLGDSIGGNRYKVDFGSFLKTCHSRKDVTAQIARFRKEVCAKPPPNWESFFETALKRVSPMRRCSDLEVYKVEPNPELVRLLAVDPVLKNHVLKAENYHVIIQSQDRKKVLRRLEECGFLITKG